MKDNKWLQESPKIGELRKLDNGAEYLPIAVLEGLLDEYTDCDWGTENYQFKILRAGNHWMADASITLLVGGARKMTGAVTFPISSKDTNVDYSSTALSFCIANACKKLGIRFGRGLNGRLEKGETSVPIVQIEKDDFGGSKAADRLKQLIENCDDIEELKTYKLVVPQELKQLYNDRIKQLSK